MLRNRDRSVTVRRSSTAGNTRTVELRPPTLDRLIFFPKTNPTNLAIGTNNKATTPDIFLAAGGPGCNGSPSVPAEISRSFHRQEQHGHFAITDRGIEFESPFQQTLSSCPWLMNGRYVPYVGWRFGNAESAVATSRASSIPSRSVQKASMKLSRVAWQPSGMRVGRPDRKWPNDNHGRR
jgi:hypothetical protein